MSRRGDCWDNAVVESFFATLKRSSYTETPIPAETTRHDEYNREPPQEQGSRPVADKPARRQQERPRADPHPAESFDHCRLLQWVVIVPCRGVHEPAARVRFPLIHPVRRPGRSPCIDVRWSRSPECEDIG